MSEDVKDLAKWVVSHFPENYHRLRYLEPFGGSMGIWWNKAQSAVEFYNDQYGKLHRLFGMMADQTGRQRFCLNLAEDNVDPDLHAVYQTIETLSFWLGEESLLRTTVKTKESMDRAVVDVLEPEHFIDKYAHNDCLICVVMPNGYKRDVELFCAINKAHNTYKNLTTILVVDPPYVAFRMPANLLDQLEVLPNSWGVLKRNQ